MSKTRTYTFDEQTCSFIEVQESKIRIAYWALAIGLFALVAASVVTWGFDQVIQTPQELALQDENEALQRQLRSVTGRIDVVTDELALLQNMDKEFYRTLLNAGDLSEDVLQVGVGGSDPYPEFSRFSVPTSSLLTETASKIDRLERQLLLQNESYRELAGLAASQQVELNEMPAILPVNGRITSGFGIRFHPVLKISRMHPGLDFHAPVGTPVYATGDGIILEAKSGAGLGRYIKVKHETAGYITVFAHLSKIETGIRKGRAVNRGDLIGYSGNTGLSEAPHLHYEVRDLQNRKLNPLFFFAPSVTPAEYERLLAQSENTTLIFD